MIPGARLKILPGGVHNAWMEYLDELTAELSAFFGRT